MSNGEEEYRRSLCFSCSKACVNACCWSADLIPVKGWTAQPTRMGYLVIECPEFDPDGDDRGRPESFDNDGVTNLLEATMTLCRNDYITGSGLYTRKTTSGRYTREGDYKSSCPKAANRRLIEKFLRSSYAQQLFFIRDPEQIIIKLRRMASIYDTQNMK